MERTITAFIYILSLSSAYSHITNSQRLVDNVLETYIVHVKQPKFQTLSAPLDLETYYKSFLPKSPANGPSPSLVYSYRNVITGFAAKLTTTHLKAMEKKDGFLFARPQQTLALHTTHTPEFLGLSQSMGIWPALNYGKGVIIGVLDTGISPNHPSFSDEGMAPPPEKWRGKCEFENARCNNKIIGARSFLHEETHPDPEDKDGHGTHTSSTAAGYFVKGANVSGQAEGTAVGMAPLAHISMYQVCNELGMCSGADVLAGIDAAVEDKVDVISLSLGSIRPLLFINDSIAIGTYAAMRNGIFVSCSAGNSGPSNRSVTNGAPWVLTVGASTMDRAIRSTALLGNGEELDGETLYQPIGYTPPPMLPLVYAGADDPASAYCLPGYFDNKTDVRGKVVLCEGGWDRIGLKGPEVKRVGGAGMILMNDEHEGYSTLAYPHVLPAVHLSYAAGVKIKGYINSSTKPTATILLKGTVIGVKTAPEVTYFSSRGPNFASPGILKPDIIGPGLNVLAAWPNYFGNERFQVDSGTSMSCPHLSGIAALLKSAHPDWSPAAIKSAIMTTADIYNLGNELIQDEKRNPANFFAVGSGHVNITRATDPGLVYDTEIDDYISYLCGLNYTDDEVSAITRTEVNCSKVTVIREAELNYPSFSVALGDSSLTYTRIVTNVGPTNASYEALVTNPPGVEVTVEPTTLEFTEMKQKLKFEITFTLSSSVPNSANAQGFIEWRSNTSGHCVRSPLSVTFMN